MNSEKNGMNMDPEQTRQFFKAAIEEAVTNAVEQAVNPRFDEQDLRMDEQSRKMEEQSRKMEEQSRNMRQQNRKMERQNRNMRQQNRQQNRDMEKLRTDMRIAISESNADRLKGTMTISGLITGLGSAIAIGVSAIVVSLLK